MERLRNKDVHFDRLRLVKDIFVFCCYTGLAYVDVPNLKREEIVVGIDNKLWINTERQKTTSETRLPLLPEALEILHRYKDRPRCINDGFALPVLTNQKMNAYLKEIADICELTKNLTFHIARHTFATLLH